MRTRCSKEFYIFFTFNIASLGIAFFGIIVILLHSFNTPKDNNIEYNNTEHKFFFMSSGLYNTFSKKRRIQLVKKQFQDNQFSNLKTDDKFACFYREFNNSDKSHYLMVYIFPKDFFDTFYGILFDYNSKEAIYLDSNLKSYQLKIDDFKNIQKEYKEPRQLVEYLLAIFQDETKLERLSLEQQVS